MISSDKSWPILCSFCGLVMYFLTRVSGSELVVGAVLVDTLSQRSPSLPPLWESAALVNLHLHCAINPLCVPNQIQLYGCFSFIILTVFIHSLNRQALGTHCVPGTLRRQWGKTCPHIKKADAQEMRHTHSELWLWYTLDMRKCLQRLSRKETDKHREEPPPLWLENFFSSSRFQLNCHGFREVFLPVFISLLSWQSL